MAALLLLSALALWVSTAQAYWGLLLDSSNSWTSLTYTMTVPPLPAWNVLENWTQDDTWYFWCGLQDPGATPGVIQPVLSWGQKPQSGYVSSDGGWSQYEWLLELWAVRDSPSGQTFQSPALTLTPGDTLKMTIQLSGDEWQQSVSCASGTCGGQQYSLPVPWRNFLQTSVANLMLCEPELYGPQTSAWNFDVVWTDITLTAASSSGVQALCEGITGYSDGSQVVTTQGAAVTGDGKGCHWDEIRISPA